MAALAGFLRKLHKIDCTVNIAAIHLSDLHSVGHRSSLFLAPIAAAIVLIDFAIIKLYKYCYIKLFFKKLACTATERVPVLIHRV